jgi:hypothetical protein
MKNTRRVPLVESRMMKAVEAESKKTEVPVTEIVRRAITKYLQKKSMKVYLIRTSKTSTPKSNLDTPVIYADREAAETACEEWNKTWNDEEPADVVELEAKQPIEKKHRRQSRKK